jgi:hypothetical protein
MGHEPTSVRSTSAVELFKREHQIASLPSVHAPLQKCHIADVSENLPNVHREKQAAVTIVEPNKMATGGCRSD